MAVNACVADAKMVGVAGDTDTLVRYGADDAALTVTDLVAFIPEKFAVIVAVPAATPETMPFGSAALLTKAMVALLDDHVARLVTSLVELSANVAVSFRARFSLTPRIGVAGAIASEDKVVADTRIDAVLLTAP